MVAATRSGRTVDERASPENGSPKELLAWLSAHRGFGCMEPGLGSTGYLASTPKPLVMWLGVASMLALLCSRV